jgi:formate hydrogenlyase subunit 3/multisubunit Na+/H+ antiporter MnhD subunit
MNEILTVIILPVIAGILLFFIPGRLRKLKGLTALLISIVTGYFAIAIFNSGDRFLTLEDITSWPALLLPGGYNLHDLSGYLVFHSDSLGRLITILIAGFTILILLYSIAYENSMRVAGYFSYFLITTGCAFGAVLSDNLLLFLLFWGVLGLTLYKLIPGKDESASAAAKKTLILIGASDSIMILGIALLWKITGSLSIARISVATTNTAAIVAFLALLTGSFTKAGAFPFHSWVPDFSESAPASSSAYLPASLDKLLGIYFLARITNGMFVLNQWLSLLLILTGVTSIIVAVMMALTQHNYKRLLGYHAVSQVGYMILGFGLGSVIGVAAGLFHMINNALYKSGLFLCAGSVEYRTGKDNIEDLGGLSKAMPLTFFATMIFAMSISGIPPLNGFASKWMIYQGIIDFGSGQGIASKLWFIWLGLAVLGSALTMASFIKLTGGIFLGRRKTEFDEVREVPFAMWLPITILAAACIFTGVFATGFIVPVMLIPVAGKFEFTGFWNSSIVSLLVLISFIAGIIVYLFTGLRKYRMEESFTGGEKIQDEVSFTTPEFYKTIGEFSFFAWMYRKAEEKWFDLYDLSKKLVLGFSHALSDAHEGVLTGYVIWVLSGLIIMLFIML